MLILIILFEFEIFFFFQAEDGIRDPLVTGVQACALPISSPPRARRARPADGSTPTRNAGHTRRRRAARRSRRSPPRATAPPAPRARRGSVSRASDPPTHSPRASRNLRSSSYFDSQRPSGAGAGLTARARNITVK